MINKIISSNIFVLWIVWGIYMVSGAVIPLAMKIGAFIGMIIVPVLIGIYLHKSFNSSVDV